MTFQEYRHAAVANALADGYGHMRTDPVATPTSMPCNGVIVRAPLDFVAAAGLATAIRDGLSPAPVASFARMKARSFG